MLKLLSSLVLTANILVSIKANCPQPEVLYPCKCSQNTNGINSIECKEGKYSIKSIFKAISISITSDKEFLRLFDRFFISNELIEEFEDNIFGDIKFKQININCPNLRRISINAFNSSVDTIETFTVIDSKIGENSNGVEIFRVLSSFNNLKTIWLPHHKIPAIPSNAFSNNKQINLETIAFNSLGAAGMGLNSEAIKSIGNYAFSALTNLKNLDLYGLGIDFIPKNAFDFHYPSNQTLTIGLGNNPLSGSSFETGLFLGSKRPIELNFIVKYSGDHYDSLHFLDEKVFVPFLRLNKKNKIILVKNPIYFHFACDCRSYWIVRDKIQFKDQLNLGINCPRDEPFKGKSILEVDESLFSNCK